MRGYVEAVNKLAYEILELMAVGLEAPDPSVLSRLIRDGDSLLRFNHYPKVDGGATSPSCIGFGEHTDPQILTLLRSNDVDGLQISLDDGVWVPVNSHPVSAFCINVGDVLQVDPIFYFGLFFNLAVLDEQAIGPAPLSGSLSSIRGPPCRGDLVRIAFFFFFYHAWLSWIILFVQDNLRLVQIGKPSGASLLG